jgi:hypothetical protein
MRDDRSGNRVTNGPRWRDPHPPTILKVAADSVPYGSSISHNGRTVWAAYDDAGTLIAVAATSDEVRRKYRSHQRAEGAGRRMLIRRSS